MKIETAKALVNGTGALAGSTGLVTSVMAYLKAEAMGIGALCAIMTLIAYIASIILHHKKSNEAEEYKIKVNLILDKLDRLDKG